MNEIKEVAVCSACSEAITGIRDGDFLLPLWILKESSAKKLPHGPRLYSFELMKCWHCSFNDGEDWHR